MMNPLTKLKPVHLVMLNEISKKRRLSVIKLVEEFLESEYKRLKL
jgi:hypothetical protein